MGAEPLPIHIEDLLEHAGWVRALARSLVADSGAAEDLVQETWLAALRRPPNDRRNLRGWLGRVVTNAARQRGRREAPRRAVEASAVGADDVQSPDQLVAAIETQRELAKHVLDLDEPYRRTVILRYWQGLDSKQIAEREGVPAGTVRWRLKQGLDRLRVRLDASHGGDRRAWCVALAPLLERGVTPQAATSLSALLHGALAMNLALKLALLSTALVVAFLGLRITGVLDFGPAPQVRPVATAAPRTDEREAGTVVTVRDTAEPEPDRRAAIAPDSATPSAARVAPDTRTRVTARAVDEAGQPVADALMGTPYGSDGEIEANASGELALEVDPHAESNSMDFVVRAPGHAAAHVEAIAIRAEVLHLGDVVLAPGADVAGRVVDRDGNPVEGARVVHERDRQPLGGMEQARRERMRSSSWMEERTDEDGGFALRGVPTGRWRIWAEKDGHLASFSEPIEVLEALDVGGVAIVLDPIPRDDVIAGVVLGADGEPVPYASVSFRHKGWFSSGSHSTTTDAEGRFEEPCDPRTPRDMHVSARDGRWGDVLLKKVRPGTTDLVVRLGEPVPVVFRVVGPDGEHVEDAHIWIWDRKRENPFGQGQQAQIEDSYRLTAPSVPFIAVVSAPGYEEREFGPFDPAALPTPIECQLRALPGVRGTVMAGGIRVPEATASVTRVSDGYAEKNGFVVHVRGNPTARSQTDDEGRFLATVRERERYFVRVEAEGWAAHEHGPVSIDPSQGLDLGTIELTPGGAIEGRVMPAAGADPAGTIVGISRGDGHARTQRVGPDGAFFFEHLIPGPWLVEIRDEELDPNGSSWMQDSNRRPAAIPSNCEVREGSTTRVDASVEGQAPCVLEGTLLVDGRPADGWSATLHDADSQLITDEDREEVTGRDGRFRIARAAPGRYRLILSGDASANLAAEVELEIGTTAWSAEIELATLDVEGLPTGLGRMPGAVYVWEQEGLLAVAPLYSDGDEGQATGLRLPAGPARITHFEPMGFEHPRDLVTWLAVDLPAGETTRVQLP